MGKGSIALIAAAAAAIAAFVAVFRSPSHSGEPAAPGTSNSEASPASLAEIRAITEEARKASLSGDDKTAISLTEESARKLEAAAATSKGAEKVVMDYAAALAKSQNDVLTKYIGAANKYADAGAASLAGLHDSAALEARVALLSDAITAHDDALKYFRTISDRIPRELAARGVAKKDSDEFLAGFVANAKIENLLAIHSMEHGMLLAARRRFEILRDNPGRWSVGERGALVASETFPAGALTEFNHLGDEIDRLATKQAELIEERKSGG